MPGVVRRVGKNNLHFSEVATKKQFHCFEVIAFDIQVLCVVPIYALRGHWLKCCATWCLALPNCISFAWPNERITFVTLFDFITEDEPKLLKINRSFALGDDFGKQRLYLLDALGNEILGLKIDFRQFSHCKAP